MVKQAGHAQAQSTSWDVSMGAEGADQHHCEMTLNYLWSWEMGKVPEDWRKPSVTPMGKKRTTGQSASRQSWECDEANPPGNPFQTHESNEE